jgi:origin recognition complex subunit 2
MPQVRQSANIFPPAKLVCRQGFSLLFYGFGSKRALLESFANDACQDGGVLAVNGYANGLTIRLLLQRVAKALRLPAGRSSDPSSLLQAIRDAPIEQPLYLIIHNIEGPGVLCLPSRGDIRHEPGVMLLMSPT